MLLATSEPFIQRTSATIRARCFFYISMTIIFWNSQISFLLFYFLVCIWAWPWVGERRVFLPVQRGILPRWLFPRLLNKRKLEWQCIIHNYHTSIIIRTLWSCSYDNYEWCVAIVLQVKTWERMWSMLFPLWIQSTLLQFIGGLALDSINLYTLMYDCKDDMSPSISS